MSKREKEQSSLWLKLVSVFLLVFAVTGLLGSFGFSIGNLVYSMFKAVMGSLAWAGPFLCFVTAVLLWIYSPSLIRNRPKMFSNRSIPNELQESKVKQDIFSKGISLPAGKLVSLQGFDQYFSSPDMLEIKDSDVQKMEDMKEMGRDFPTYFGTGETFYPRKIGKMTTLKGLKGYIEEVDEEERFGREIPRENCNALGEISKLTAERPMLFSSPFKSQEDQKEYLAQFKDCGDDPQDFKSHDLLGGLREECTTLDLSGPIAHVGGPVTELSSETELLGNPIEYFKEEIAVEVESQECELVDDSSGALLESACTSLDMQVLDRPEAYEPYETTEAFEVPQAPVLTLKPMTELIVAQVDEPLLERVDHWTLPDFDLLEPVIKRIIIQDTETSQLLEKVLLDFGVKAKVIRVTRGPVITRYELAPAPGVKISKIVNLADDIALGLAARDVRIEAPIPGKAAIGIEVPNKQARSVPFREVLDTTSFGEYPSKLKVALGKDIADQPIIGDLSKMPHLLVAGATGSGKSVCVTSIINSILYNATPDEVKFLLVDPKMVELSQYNGIPHLLAPVVVDPKKAASALKWIVKEMENRYELFAAAGVRDIERYNKMKAGETISWKPALPFIVVIIDELADLMMVAAGEVEEAICRLAQMARAAGIHLVIATQRPSVDVITGVIKANIPSRISFAVSSQIDSRTILDATGAEKLLGRGDMLYSPLGVNKALRVQGCLVTDDEVQRVITHWKGLGRPEYLDPEHLFAETTAKNEDSNGPDDVLFIDAGQLFIRTGIASVSFLQRKLKLGYTRAARLMDMLQEQGVVGTYEGSKPRQVLLSLDEFNERFG
ncbi:DNA translocase FtsK [Desulfosporosinus fructosivorans]